MSIFFLAIMEKSSKEKYRFTTAKTSSIPGKNQLLTVPCSLYSPFLFSPSFLWSLLTKLNYLTTVWQVDISNVFVAIIFFSNSILNPFMYAFI